MFGETRMSGRMRTGLPLRVIALAATAPTYLIYQL